MENIRQAVMTLRKTKEDYNASSGALLYPGVDANVSATREKVSGATIGQGNFGRGMAIRPAPREDARHSITAIRAKTIGVTQIAASRSGIQLQMERNGHANAEE